MALGIVLLQGPGGALLLTSEVLLYAPESVFPNSGICLEPLRVVGGAGPTAELKPPARGHNRGGFVPGKARIIDVQRL